MSEPKVLTKKQVEMMDEIHRFVCRYIDEFGKAVTLKIINTRFGVQIKRAMGVSVLTAIEADGRFYTALNERGGTNIASDPGLKRKSVSELDGLAEI